MTRLSSVLYQYVLERSEAFLALMPEYPDCRRFSDEKEAALRAALSPEAGAPARGGAGGRLSSLHQPVQGAVPVRPGVGQGGSTLTPLRPGSPLPPF